MVSVLRILLNCKFLNFAIVFTKKINFPEFAYNFRCEKVNFSLIRPLILPFITLEEYYQVLRFSLLSVKVTLIFLHAGAWPLGGQGGHSTPTSTSDPKKVQQFQFQTSEILFFMGVQKLYGPKIS